MFANLNQRRVQMTRARTAYRGSMAATGFENTRGNDSRTRKITEDQAMSILMSNLPAKDLAAKYGVSVSTVYSIRKRKIWGHLKV